MEKINIDWLKDDKFDDKYYSQANFCDGTYRIIDIWCDEGDLMTVMPFSKLVCIELNRYYTPAHARWMNDSVHKGFRFIHNLN